MRRGLCFTVCSLAALAIGLAGCSRKATQRTADLSLDLSKIDTILVSAQTVPDETYYLLEGKAIPAFVDALRAETESAPPAVTGVQVEGGDIDVYAFDPDGALLHRINVTYQWVEGLRGKGDPDRRANDSLLDGQRKSLRSVRALIQKVGAPVAAEEFDRRVRTAARVDRTQRCWKN